MTILYIVCVEYKILWEYISYIFTKKHWLENDKLPGKNLAPAPTTMAATYLVKMQTKK